MPGDPLLADDPLIWLDGARSTSLPLPDRGLAFGDGLFETLLVHWGRPLYLDLHLERLQCGLGILGFPECIDSVERQLVAVLGEAPIAKEPWVAMRITVTRGDGPRGYAPPEIAQPRVLLQANPLARDCAQMSPAANLAVASLHLSSQPTLAGIKHLNRLEQVLAAREAALAGLDEILLLDVDGHVNSVAAGNIYVLREGCIFTPVIDLCGVAGTRRRLMLQQWAGAVGLEIRETRLTLQDVLGAQEVFYSNSLQTVRPVARIDSVEYEDHRACAAIFEHFLGELT